MTPQDQSASVTEAASVAAAKARHARAVYENWADVGGERHARLVEEARLDIEAAYPAIRTQIEAEIRERLDTDAARWQAFDALGDLGPLNSQDPFDVVNAVRRALLDAALPSNTKEEGAQDAG